jgi:hypothetical protein
MTRSYLTLSVLAKMFGDQANLFSVLIDKPWLQAAQKDLRGEAREDR